MAKKAATTFFKPLADFERVHRSIPTGSLGIDLISGNGGFIRNAINRVCGPEAVGKSGLLYKTAANAAAMGMNVWWVDTEISFDKDKMMAALHDVKDLGRIFVNSYSPLDETLLTVEVITQRASEFFEANKNNGGSLLIIDSMDNLITHARAEADVYDTLMGMMPRVLNRWLPNLVGEMVANDATAIFVSQARADLKSQYNEYTYNGGFGLKHNSSFTLEIKGIGQLKIADTLVGRKIKAVITKNKAGNNWKFCEYALRYDIGIDNAGEVIDWGIEYGLITKKAAWLYYGDESFNGREAMREWLLANQDKLRFIENQIRSTALNKPLSKELDTESIEGLTEQDGQ